MKFEWDSNKAASNQAKHGISFNEAATAFDDPFALIAPDTRHSTAEERREWLIGESDVGVVVVVFTVRQPGPCYRIISARKAQRRERILYEQAKTFPL